MTATVRSLLIVGCSMLAILNLASCNTIPAGAGGAITKIKAYKLDPSQRQKKVGDPMIRFERQNRLYGAVTRADQMERAGQYYTVFWEVTDRTQPVTVRLEYRQRDTGLVVHTLDTEITKVSGSNVTEFQVTGDAFSTNGAVSSYRVSLVRGKQVLASADSFLWK